MSGKTSTPAGSANAQFVQAAGLFAQSMQRNSTINRLSGNIPQGESSAAATLRNQSSIDMPIVKAQDLGKNKGDEVEFHFLQPVGAYPIMGRDVAEGKGTGMSLDKFRLRVDQARFPIDLGDTMSDLRSPVEFRKLGRPVAQSLMDAYLDQSTLVHMAGARGFQNNIEWRVPVTGHPSFAKTLINPVKAPTRNRHWLATGDSIQPFKVNAGAVDIASTDMLTMDVIDSVRTVVETIALPPPAVKIPGDVVAEDSPLRCMLVSPAQYQSFAQDPAFRQFQAQAMTRASKAKNHPLFLGEVGLWNGILICKMPKPIRFYAGNEIRYCAELTSEAESIAVVPEAFDKTHAIDRAILLGGQALAQAFGAAGIKKGGMPFFWSEIDFDHGDKMELLIGAIQGLSKIRWLVDQGNGMSHYTDHGVIAIDTVVPLISGEI